jgi:signal transduction histidine kinase
MGIPIDADTVEYAHAQDLLLKTHLALAQATNEQEIIAALALGADPQAQLRLLYLDLDQFGSPLGAQVVASWKDNALWEADPLLSQPMERPQCPFVSFLEQERDPLWFIADIGETPLETIRHCFPEICALVAIKLMGTAHIDKGNQWHSLILISWAASHSLTHTEKYIYASLVDALSVMVSNHRLRTEALENFYRLQSLDRLKSAFLHSISHELRTPLAAMISTTDALLAGASGELSAEAQTDITLVQQSSEHLLTIINDLLDMASIEAGKMQVYPEWVNAGALLKEAIRTIEPLAAQKGLGLACDPLTNLPMIWADPVRIRQVLLNLLSNAVKFTPQGSIRVCTEIRGDELLISIADTGIGIALPDHTLIFERFQRVDSQTGRLAGGTGLGLPISKHLVEAHGGRIWLTSEPNQGSTFAFSLPLDRT